MRKFWNELLADKHPAVIAWTGGLIALLTIVPIFSAKILQKRDEIFVGNRRRLFVI
jgi:hypothetical protein